MITSWEFGDRPTDSIFRVLKCSKNVDDNLVNKFERMSLKNVKNTTENDFSCYKSICAFRLNSLPLVLTINTVNKQSLLVTLNIGQPYY